MFDQYIFDNLNAHANVIYSCFHIVDPEALAGEAEAALFDEQARVLLIGRLKDGIVDVIASALPSLKLPDISGESSEAAYRVRLYLCLHLVFFGFAHG